MTNAMTLIVWKKFWFNPLTQLLNEKNDPSLSPLPLLTRIENNCEILACSTDSEFCHRAWVMTDRKKGGLEKINFPILADTTLEISTR